MNLAEVYKQLEDGELHPVPAPADSPVTFYCADEDYGVLSKPRPAAEYYDTQQKNFTTPRKLRDIDQVHTESSPLVESTMRTGWIIPFSAELYHNPTATDRNGLPSHDISNYLTKYGHVSTTACEGHPFLVRTKWAVELQDGYSLLLIPPVNYSDSRFSVLPRIIDADKHPVWITIPVIPRVSETVIKAGTPLAQAIPIERTTIETPATVGTFQADEHPPDEFEETEADTV